MPALVDLLAHQGGWDEMLFVLIPIGIFAGLLALANKRAEQKLAERDGAPPAADPSTEPGPGPDPGAPPS